MNNELSEKLNDVTEQLNKYITLDYNMSEVSDLIIKSSKLGRLFITGAQFASQKRFEFFMKGLGNGEDVSEEQLNKLKEYVKNEKRAQFICDYLDKVIRSNSIQSSMMMGIFLYETIDKDKDPSIQKLMVINALSQLYDADIDNLDYIFKELFSNFGNKISIKEEDYSQQMWVKYFKKTNSRLSGIEYTIEKAMNLQLLKEDTDTFNAKMYKIFNTSLTPEYILKMTSPGNQVRKLIENIKKFY